jgi:DNA-binding transcriptional regulator YiaG
MSTRTKERALSPPADNGVQNRRAGKPSEKLLGKYDATALVGLRTLVYAAAIQRVDKTGDTTIEVPQLRQLAASAAVARCLMPVRLLGSEIRTMRRIMKLTLGELAKKLDVKTAPETISRWESEQSMGGYAEKLLRLLVCEELAEEAPGVDYRASLIANLRVLDPWRAKKDFEVPYVKFDFVKMKLDSDGVIDAYTKTAA